MHWMLNEFHMFEHIVTISTNGQLWNLVLGSIFTLFSSTTATWTWTWMLLLFNILNKETCLARGSKSLGNDWIQLITYDRVYGRLGHGGECSRCCRSCWIHDPHVVGVIVRRSVIACVKTPTVLRCLLPTRTNDGNDILSKQKQLRHHQATTSITSQSFIDISNNARIRRLWRWYFQCLFIWWFYIVSHSLSLNRKSFFSFLASIMHSRIR